MNSARRQPQYLDPFLITHLDDLASVSVQPARRSWWFIVSLVLLVALVFSLALAGVMP